MTSEEQNSDLTVNVIAGWLDERGFNEAATHLLEASDEVAQRVGEAEQVEWLYYQHELKEAHRRQQGLFRRYAEFFRNVASRTPGGCWSKS